MFEAFVVRAKMCKFEMIYHNAANGVPQRQASLNDDVESVFPKNV